MKGLRVKIESEDGTVTGTRIYDQETGKQLGCVQKVTYVVDSNSFTSEAVLEIINLPIKVENVFAEIKPVLFGRDLKTIEDMSQDEIIEALKFEAKQRYLLQLKLGDE